MMSMEKKHKCKLCSRKFSSGKAMGGHMRSHLRTLPLPPKTPPQKQDSSAAGESTLEQEEDKFLGDGLRENPKKSLRWTADPDHNNQLLEDGSVVVHDGESETESTKKPIRMKRSKRTRKIFNPEQVLVKKEKLSTEFEPVSSFSDEEDIAICLMMLSKDNWGRRTTTSSFKCEICNKVLKSSQALGSHKTIHKKNVISCSTDEHKEVKSSKEKSRVKNVDGHECPFCGKIYESGQALGGHKRSHILSSSTTASSSSIMESTSVKFPNGFIDLNMPAPMEDEDFSQLEVSAVS